MSRGVVCLFSRQGLVISLAVGVALVIGVEVATAAKVKGGGSGGLLSGAGPKVILSGIRRWRAKQRLSRQLHTLASEPRPPFGLDWRAFDRWVPGQWSESSFPTTRLFDHFTRQFEREHGALNSADLLRVAWLRRATLAREIDSHLRQWEPAVREAGDATFQRRTAALLVRAAEPLRTEPQRFAAVLSRLESYTHMRGLGKPLVHQRFHLGTAALQEKFAPEMQGALDAIARYDLASGASGTGFLVAHTTPGRGWMLTALHRQNAPEGQACFFLGGADRDPISAPVTDCVADGRLKDFALVEIGLSPELAKLEPISLSADPPLAGQKVYTGGYPLLQEPGLLTSMHQNMRAGDKHLWERMVSGPDFDLLRVLSVGYETNHGRLHQEYHHGSTARHALFSLPADHGSSVGPIIASDGPYRHHAVATVVAEPMPTEGYFGGVSRWRGDALPTSEILGELKRMLADGEIALKHRAHLKQLLERSGHAKMSR